MITIELFYFGGCPLYQKARKSLEQLIGEEKLDPTIEMIVLQTSEISEISEVSEPVRRAN